MISLDWKRRKRKGKEGKNKKGEKVRKGRKESRKEGTILKEGVRRQRTGGGEWHRMHPSVTEEAVTARWVLE